MSRALEALLGWFLEAVTFFDNLQSRRNDDEVTREFKALKRRLVWAASLAIVALIGSLLFANFFNAVSDALRNPAPVEDLRQVVALTLVSAMGATLAFVAYSAWALWRFVRENSDE
jgi:hypothetical protein